MIKTIDNYDYFDQMPNYLNLDPLGDDSEIVDSLDNKYENCIAAYERGDFEALMAELNVSCTVIIDAYEDILGLLFPTEQDKLAFILKVS